MEQKRSTKNLAEFIDAIARLRAPGGCPWDREQDHKSLKKYLLNEAYELIDAIDSDEPDEICEELGDVLLQVILHAQIASENNLFDIEDVSSKIRDKIIHRHPHVFADVHVNNSKEVVANWEAIKHQEKPDRTSALDGVPNSAPALMRAENISKKAVAVGFEWPDINMLWDTFYSEIDEFKQAIDSDDKDKIRGEMGDILFSLVNIARWYKVDPEMALQETNKKFISRFHLMEQQATKNLTEYTQPELEELWQQAKKLVK